MRCKYKICCLGHILWQEEVIPVVRRYDGSEDFNRLWADYKFGFGNRCGEFWLGLDTMHSLTTGGSYGLRVFLEAWNGDQFWSEYSSIMIGPESDKFRLTISGYTPHPTQPAGDSMTVHNNRLFTTEDQDNDNAVVYNCASAWNGGWWYDQGAVAKATGLYLAGGPDDASGINWYSIYTNYYSFKSMEMALIKN